MTQTPTRPRFRAATRLLFAAALVGSAATAAEHDKGAPMSQDKAAPMSQDKAGGSEMQRMMNADMQEMAAMELSGDVDHDFATLMRRHHQSGIEMAEMQLKEGKDAELKKIAQKIKDGQKKEIEALDRWLKTHKAPQR